MPQPEELLGSELVNQMLQVMMSCVVQACVTSSDLYQMGWRELRPLALVTSCQVNKLNITRLELWSQRELIILRVRHLDPLILNLFMAEALFSLIVRKIRCFWKPCPKWGALPKDKKKNI